MTIAAVAKLLVILLLAETLATAFALPVPGSILGLAAVFALFLNAGREDAEIGRMFDAVAPHATLLFVPAAVGVISNLDAIASFWMAFLSTVVAGTAITLVAVGLAAQMILDRQSERSSS